MTPFRTERLANGVVVEFFDRTNRYFGDYHRVCVEVRLTALSPADAACAQGGEPLQEVRLLERMGVPGAEVDATRCRLVDTYWQNAGGYLAHPDYSARLAASAARRAG